jgi:ketosteroid isomerase-like protein
MARLFPFSILFSPSSPWLQYDTAQFSAEEPCMLEQRIEEVNKANHAFYAAFGNLDIGEMDKIWAHLEYVTCIHPGWTLRSGWPLVRDSWVLIFNNTFSMTFELTDVMVQVAGDIAWVVCVENITTHQSDEPQQAQVIATNLFERIGDEWLMIHHHGSAVMG